MIGTKINNYEIVSLLGEGGMGSVYVAVHPVLGRRVAVKVLRREFAEDKTLVVRFMNEARAASAIRQPNIIEILDVGTLPDGIPYLIMELLEGESLASRLYRDKRLGVKDALAIATQAATALGAAHAKQIIHRDLKPDNLFLVPDERAPRGLRVVVLDFGIAKLRGELSTEAVKTHSGSVMGTPPYMSPEQCRGLIDDIDQRTDIYALGIILHEMLSGAPPFVSAGFGDLVVMHIMQPPVPLRQLDSQIPPHVEAAVLRALEKPREARFASMEALQDALLDFSSAAAGAATLALPPAAHATAGGDRRRQPETQVLDAPRTKSTLTLSAGERVSPDPRQAVPTVPMRRSRTLMVALGLVLGGGAVAGAIFLSSGRGPSRRRAAPVSDGTLSGAVAPDPAPPFPPAEAIPPASVPVPPPAPAAVPPPPSAPPPSPEPASAASATPPSAPPPADIVPDHRDAARIPKRPTPPRASRSKNRAGEASRAAPGPTPAPSRASAPTTPAPAPAGVAPPAPPTPKISIDKW